MPATRRGDTPKWNETYTLSPSAHSLKCNTPTTRHPAGIIGQVSDAAGGLFKFTLGCPTRAVVPLTGVVTSGYSLPLQLSIRVS